MDKNKASRRGRNSLPGDEKRTHCVSVRLNKIELEWLDKQRKNNKKEYLRGEYLRMAALGKLPKVVPGVNKKTWLELGFVGNNLNQIARHLNEGDRVIIDEIVSVLSELRDPLIGIKGDLNG